MLIPDEKKNYKLIDLINYRLSSKIIEWKQKCERCNIYGLNHHKYEQFDMIGNYIIIYVQRINKFLRKKNLSIIEFGENLNLGDLFYEKKNTLETSFKLLGIIYHVGSLEEGHYYTVIKIRDKWVQFNDNKVGLLTNIEFKSKEVCAFLYEK